MSRFGGTGDSGVADGSDDHRKASGGDPSRRPEYAPAFDMSNRDLPPWVGDFGRRYQGRELPDLPSGYDERCLDQRSLELARRPVLWREVRPLYVVTGDYDHTQPGATHSMLWVMIHHDDSASLHTPNIEHPDGLDVAEDEATSSVTSRVVDSELKLGIVPPTALFQAHAGAGVIQDWVYDATPGLYYEGYPAYTQAKMAVLDYAMATRYRGDNTYLTGDGRVPGEKRLFATGNKYGAPGQPTGADEISSDFVYGWRGRPLPADLVTQLRGVDGFRLADRLLYTGRCGQSVAGILDRFDEVRETGRIGGDAWAGRIRSSNPMDPW